MAVFVPTGPAVHRFLLSVAILGLSAALPAAPVPVVKVIPVPGPDPDATTFDKPPKGSLRQLGSRQMRHPLGMVGDFAADGLTLFTAGHGVIREWDTDTNTLRRTIPVDAAGKLMRVKSTPNADTLLVWDMKKVQVFDRATKKRLRTLEVPGQRIDHFALSPDGKDVVVGTYEGHVRVFDVNDGTIRELDITHPPVERRRTPPFITGVAWAPDGKTLATSAWRSDVRGWDVHTGKELWTIPCETNGSPLAFTPDGKGLIADYQADRRQNSYGAGLWDVATQQPKELRGFVTGDGVAVSRDGRYFTNGSQVWDTKADKWIHSLTLPASPDSAAFSRDGKRMACGSNGVRLFDVATGKELLADTGHAGQVVEISVTPDGKTAATAGHDGTARVWDVESGKLLHTFAENFGRVASVSITPDGKRLAVGDLDWVKVFDLTTGKEVWKAEGHRELMQVAFSPDGKTVAAGGNALTVHLYDAKTGESIRTLVGFSHKLDIAWHFAWTPDSTGIVSPVCLTPKNGGDVGPLGEEGDGKVRFVLWEVKTGEKVRAMGEPAQKFHAPLAFSPDGKHLAVGGDKVTLVEVKTGKEVWAADVPGEYGLAFTGDGTLYADRVCLSAKTGKKESELPADTKQLRALAVPSKGKVVLTAAAGDNTVVVWPK